MTMKQCTSLVGFALLAIAIPTNSEGDTQDSGTARSNIDIQKFLETKVNERLMVVSVSLRTDSNEYCKVDFYENTTIHGTFFVRHYLHGNRLQRSNKQRESFIGEFRHLHQATLPKLDSMYIYQYDLYESHKTLKNQLSPENVETIMFQSNDNVCAIFATSPDRRSNREPQSSFDLRIRASDINAQHQQPCLRNAEEFLNSLKQEKGNFRVPDMETLKRCKLRCEQQSSCNPGHST
uniref:Lipocalin/cytosolic fatty-acid binding domain-containing protein n=1 Tax=Amblyomma maculatum TaxID=34609 RepID=G3MKX4_AMBMU